MENLQEQHDKPEKSVQAGRLSKLGDQVMRVFTGRFLGLRSEHHAESAQMQDEQEHEQVAIPEVHVAKKIIFKGRTILFELAGYRYRTDYTLLSNVPELDETSVEFDIQGSAEKKYVKLSDTAYLGKLDPAYRRGVEIRGKQSQISRFGR